MDKPVFIQFRPGLRNGFLGFLVSAVICIGFRINRVLCGFFKGLVALVGFEIGVQLNRNGKEKVDLTALIFATVLLCFSQLVILTNNPMLRHYLHTHCFFRRDTSCTDTK
jgi:hypothetical protein